MLRIIDGCAYEGKQADWFKVKAFDLGNGHLEVTVYRPTVWRETDMEPGAIEAYLEALERHRDETEQARRELHAKQSATRAKKRVRQLCKVMGVDTLLTLTYRACEADLGRCKADLKEFVRRLRRIVPDFQAVCGFELQERGAWHVHLCCRKFDKLLSYKGAKVKSWNVLRAVWRSVTKDRGGNVDVQSRKRNSQRSPAKLAAYVSKYITKGFAEGERWSNRWTKFGDAKPPEPIDLGIWHDMREALMAAYGLMVYGQVVSNARVSRWGDSFFLFAEAGTAPGIP